LLLNEVFVVIYTIFFIISDFFYVAHIRCYLTRELERISDVGV